MRTFAKLLLVVTIFLIGHQSVHAEEVVVRDPLLIKGIGDYKAERFEEAVPVLIEARERDPNSAIAAYYLGLTYKQMLEYEKAAPHLRDAMTFTPGVKEAIFYLAEMQFHLDKLEESLDMLDTADMEEIMPAETAFLRGLVLLKMNNGEEAITSFDIAKTYDPRMEQAAEYQKGVALIKLGKVKEANQTLKEVVIADPNSDLAIFAEQYMNMLKKSAKMRRPYSLFLSAGTEYDNNVYLKPSDQGAAGGISGESDWRYLVNFRADYKLRLEKGFTSKLQYSFYATEHDDLNTHDVMSQTISFAHTYSTKKMSLNALLSYNYTTVADKEYLETYSVAPEYTLSFSKNHIGQLAVRYQHKEFMQSPLSLVEDRDADEYAASLSYIYLLNNSRGVVNMRYDWNREEAQGDNWSYIGNRGSLTTSVNVYKGLRASAYGTFLHQRYDNRHTTFLKRREDLVWTGSVALTYPLSDWFSLYARDTYIRGDSNIAIYDYDKNVAGLGVQLSY